MKQIIVRLYTKEDIDLLEKIDGYLIPKRRRSLYVWEAVKNQAKKDKII